MLIMHLPLHRHQIVNQQTRSALSQKPSSLNSRRTIYYPLGDYVLFRKDRNRNGGGVAVFIHKSLTSKFLCSSTEEWTCQSGTPEYILCEVKGKGIPSFFAAVVYRPPHVPFIEKISLTTWLLTCKTTVLKS